jgi:hypothetical protein
MIATLDEMPTMSPEEVFSLDPGAVEEMQLAALKERFEDLRPRVRAVRVLADDLGIDSIDQLEDVIPLCLPHTTYKSYSVKQVEDGSYDRLTQWLDGLTTEDLSGIDVSGCDSLESWLDTIEAGSELRPTVSSGTTGKISFFPRSSIEADIFLRYMVQGLSGFRDEADSGLATGAPDWFAAVPMATGRQTFPRMFDLIRRHCYDGDGSRIHTLGRGHWDADMLWLWGRMRAADARGESIDATLTPALERVRDRVGDVLQHAAADGDRFLEDLVDGQRGKPVILFAPRGQLIDLAAQCRERGLEPDLAPGSFILTGGGSGSKGQIFPDGWEELLYGVFPGPHDELYGMTEMTATCRLCSAGWYHWPHTAVTFVLDPDTSEPLPRTGLQTGRLALFDLCARTHWGGAISGDRVTMDWDGDCPCGRLGPRVKNDVTRYSQLRDDDRITCAKSPGAYERAVDTLMELAS